MTLVGEMRNNIATRWLQVTLASETAVLCNLARGQPGAAAADV
jgi:hypothetical protein